MNGVRVNVIGFDYGSDETGILISRNKMQPRYSLDTEGKVFRVEFYELRAANLPQQENINKGLKIIANAPAVPAQAMQQALKKDKFLGSVLVEFK